MNLFFFGRPVVVEALGPEGISSHRRFASGAPSASPGDKIISSFFPLSWINEKRFKKSEKKMQANRGRSQFLSKVLVTTTSSEQKNFTSLGYNFQSVLIEEL